MFLEKEDSTSSNIQFPAIPLESNTLADFQHNYSLESPTEKYLGRKRIDSEEIKCTNFSVSNSKLVEFEIDFDFSDSKYIDHKQTENQLIDEESMNQNMRVKLLEHSI